VVVACTVGLYHLFQWWFGRPQTGSALDHFDVMPGVLAAIVVGVGTWGYHWAVASSEASAQAERLRPARRVYFYLVSAVGLVTLGVGLVMLLAVFFGLIGPAAGPSLRGDLWRNPFVLSLTLLLVGAPIWFIFWRSIQRQVVTDEATERGALSRRVFIYAVFGASILLTLVNLSIVLFNVFDAMLGGRSTTALLWDSRWSLAIVITAGLVSAYYWSVLQEDRRALAAVERPSTTEARKEVILLSVEGDGALVRRIESLLGHSVILWRRVDGSVEPPATIDDEELARVVQRIGAADSDRVVVLEEAGRLLVIPYRR
jgi:hypothetical protein